ncbi:MAG: maleylpyruvate isomerase family mycothiol-dependent enzyme [Chloroflexi bacterium]|nr:maleylpyruvate isomerase family mycothiol-dependent enzyme [Chloroflexota bacterium]
MNPQVAVSVPFAAQTRPQSAGAIPKLAREEVIPLARVELERFLALIETLTPEDLAQPTDCALWSVKDIIAHQGAHVLGLTSARETLMDQFNPLKFRDYSARGMNLLDAANQRMVDQRARWSLAELIAEIRDNMERSLAGRQRFPAVLRWMRMMAPGYDQPFTVAELIDSIYTRDMWMHRADIARATGREMIQTAEHDGRIVALVVRDVDRRYKAKLGGRAVTLHLTGKAGGEWTAGGDRPAEAALTMEVLEFNRLASGRIPTQQVLDQGLAKIDGDKDLARLALRHTMALY